MFFEYGEEEISYLAQADPALGEVIRKVGKINKEVRSDVFTFIVYSIIGQQISMAAADTIFERMEYLLGEVTAETIERESMESIQQLGMSWRKAGYIKNVAEKCRTGEVDIDALCGMTDRDFIRSLSSLSGIGAWTAEMVLIFCLQRKDVLSYGDYGICKGLQFLYGHEKINKKLFKEYQERYSPYGTIAGFYLWEVASQEWRLR